MSAAEALRRAALAPCQVGPVLVTDLATAPAQLAYAMAALQAVADDAEAIAALYGSVHGPGLHKPLMRKLARAAHVAHCQVELLEHAAGMADCEAAA